MLIKQVSFRTYEVLSPVALHFNKSNSFQTGVGNTAKAFKLQRQQPPTSRRSLTIQTRAMSADDEMVRMVQQKNSENPVVVYSKTYCPYCTEVKTLFADLGVTPKVIELNQLADEKPVSDALKQITRRTTVPQVFVGGQHLGGCDDTMAAFKAGKLQQMLENAGVPYQS